MSNLSPEARALVHAARDALRPSAADRERVLRALRASLGEVVVCAVRASDLYEAGATADR